MSDDPYAAPDSDLYKAPVAEEPGTNAETGTSLTIFESIAAVILAIFLGVAVIVAVAT